MLRLAIKFEGANRMLDIRQCFEERLMGGAPGLNDELVDMMLESDENEVYFLSTTEYFKSAKNLAKLNGAWHLSCSLALGRLFTNTSIPLNLYGFSRKGQKGVLIANWTGPNTANADIQRTAELEYVEFSAEYRQYLSECEQLVNKGTIPNDHDGAEFVRLSSESILPDKWEPAYYNKKNRALRKIVAKEETVPLGELARILIPHPARQRDAAVPTVKSKDLAFPFHADELSFDKGSDVQIEPGDVILQVYGKSNKSIVYNGNPIAYAGLGLAVIRPAGNISSEYLCLYLTSSFAKDILASLQTGLAIKQISSKDLTNLPVVVPTQGNAYYQAIYDKLANPQVRDYIDLSDLKTGKASEAEGVLDEELTKNIKAFNARRLKSFLTSDIRELNTCFTHGAYKATIILAGSILEAALIDWLSEIKNVDYFKQDYYVKRKDGRKAKATLYDYIDEIELIERPDWVDEAKMAHAIREKRNQVHAKLCIKEKDINEGTARMVCNYLEKVLKTREAGTSR